MLAIRKSRSNIEQLRSITQTEHESLEAVPALARLLSPELQVREYRDVLVRFAGVITPLQRTISAYEDDPISTGRDHAAALTADLMALEPMIGRTPSIPLRDDLPALDTFAARAGAIYVMEGSTLGGTLISRALTQSLGQEHQCATRYFSGYRADTGRHWRQFCAKLNAQKLTIDAAAEAACGVFAALRRQFADSDHFQARPGTQSSRESRKRGQCPFDHRTVNQPNEQALIEKLEA